MECAVDAQNLISISLRKIQSSRTQRGGIKLHKNLLVTYVLRNARQFYMSKTQTQKIHHYDDGSAAREKHLELTGSFTDLADDLCCNFTGVDSDTWHCGAQHSSGPAEDQDASACAMLATSDADLCWSCADKPSWELPVLHSQANQKTVLDLDTHVVTTVTNGFFHSDAHLCPGRKRKMDTSFHVVDPEFYFCDFAPCKRTRTDEDSDSEQLDSTNISNLISVLGSGGLCEFVSWQQTDLEHLLTTQTLCLKQTLLSGSGWTRAIEAF